jgi:septum formation protein
MRPPLILASSSPRRRQLLEEAGYLFEVDPSEIHEPEPAPPMTALQYAADLAWRKAAAVAARRRTGLILGVDTVCALGDEILNKPRDRSDAERMIRLQEGHEVDVISGICLYRADRHEWVGAVDFSVVRFAPLQHIERERYLDSARWQGKSGAYGVQDHDPFVALLRGSFSNVVGLPMERLANLLRSYRALASADLPVAPPASSRRSF